MKKTIIFAALLFLAGSLPAGMGRPKDIPEAGRIRIDGRLEDWKKIEWAPLDQTLDGNPVNLSNARWALQWDEDGMLYIAVQYTDADIILQNGYTGSNTQDCVEIFVRGDTGSEPLDYSNDQRSAQHYIIGLSADQKTVWKKLAGIAPFPPHNPAKAAVVLDGRTFTYEIMVPLYDSFSATSRRNCESTETYVDVEIGADIAIMDAGKTGFAGIRSENSLPDKKTNAANIAEHTLGE